jgi:hypothetical protein
MNPMIERYVYDVVRRLPEKARAEVKTELHSHIESMLPPCPTDEDIVKVLTRLGPPSRMADQYRTTKRYLISPAVFDDYVSALRFVGTILFVVTLIVNLIGKIAELSANPSATGFITAVSVTIFTSAVFSAAISFISITAIFAAIEYFNRKKQEKQWAVGDLPRMPKSPGRISRTSTIISAVFSVILSALWILVILRYSHYLAWYDGLVPKTPLFLADVLFAMIPAFIALALLLLLVNVAKLYYGEWTIQLAWLNSAHRVAEAVFFVYFMNFSNVFNPVIFVRMARALRISTEAILSYFHTGVLALCAIVIIATLWEVGVCLHKYRRKK